MLRRVLGLAVILACLLPVDATAQEVVVFVVRHAERAEDGTNDPPISELGQARSRAIAGMLEAARLTHLHTSDYRRTRSTIAPAAEATGLTPRVYDPDDLRAFAERLRSTPGRHLVVGHSNTNPALVDALGGDPGDPIGDMEYDRGYVVVVLPGGATGSAIFRFGVGVPAGQMPGEPGQQGERELEVILDHVHEGVLRDRE